MPYSTFLQQFLRRLFVCCLLLASGVGWAQTPRPLRAIDVEPGVMRVKVTEAYARQLETGRLRFTASNVVQTGVPTLDKVHRQFSARSMKRVFPQSGKYEAKHRKHGLHLWYEVEVDQKASLQLALSTYEALAEVTLAEPIIRKQLIDPGREAYKPVVLGKETPLLVRDSTAPFNDKYLKYQWHYNNTGQTQGKVGADIQLFDAWKVETGKKNVIVAIIDGGVDVQHPDLKDNLWVNEKEIPGNGKDDDGNGYVDDVHGYSFVDNSSTIDPHFHGTHVAGTVGATNHNGIGVSGVAGGSGKGDGVRLMTCATFFREEAAGGFEASFVYGADNGAVIAQNSWGHRYENLPLEQVMIDAIDYFIAEAGTDANGNQTGPMKGGIVIFAAGNDNDDGFWGPGNLPQTLSVASINHKDAKAYYSNFGDWVDIAAPGGETDVEVEGVLSTYPGGQYAFFQGTSMACPHVSGVAALVVSKWGGTGFTPEMLRGRLLKGTDNIKAENEDYLGKLGAGRLNALKALQSGDETVPRPITDLRVTQGGVSQIHLSWTSPDTASAYDIRYSTAPITEAGFEKATPAPWKGEVIPQAPGKAESFTVKGLSPTTTYYVAVKAVDYSGNASSLSNVVEATTLEAPSVTIAPLALSASLLTAQTVDQSLWVYNAGPGELEFSALASTDSILFATLKPASGTVAAGDSLQLTVQFSAAGLLAGTYEQKLKIETNDPDHEILTIDLTLDVTNNQQPIARLKSDSLFFGEVILGASLTKWVTVHNAGSDTLILHHANAEGTGFAVNWPDTLQLLVAPFRDTTVQVTYAPTALGAASGNLAIHTNDPARETLRVWLSGEGIPAPGIAVSPDSIYAALKSNEKTVKQLRIRNTGGSNLHFAIQAAAATGTPSLKQVTLDYPALIADARGTLSSAGQVTLLKTPASSGQPHTQHLSLKAMGSSAAPLKVVILSPDPDVRDFEKILDGFGDLEADVFPLEALPALQVADLMRYHVVILTNNFQWQLSGGVSAKKVGDVLADYVDAGGKVITSGAANMATPDPFVLKGRFVTEKYSAFTVPKALNYERVTLGKKLVVGHAILEGVDSLVFQGYLPQVEAAPGATALAEWNGSWTGQSYLLAAAKSNTISINLFPTFGDPNTPISSIWSGDVPTLYHNAIRWLVPAPYLSILPKMGVVAPGEEYVVDLELNAEGLNTGLYKTSLAVSSNVPGQEPVLVPLTLEVSGPEFTVAPDSIALTLDKKEKVSRKLVLKNNGTGTYSFTVSNQHTRLMGGPVIPSDSIPHHHHSSGESRVFNLDEWMTRHALPSQVGIFATFPESYQTDFENFAYGNINRQNNWVVYGEANTLGWNIDTIGNVATSGKKYVHRTSDPAGWSNLFSPVVKPGKADKSVVRMNLNFQGQGVQWEVVFRSMNALAPPITVLLVNSDGSLHMGVREGNQIKAVPMNEELPKGSFELVVEFDRPNQRFTVYINDRKVFTGRAMYGSSVELVNIGSGTENDQMHLYVDDFEIREGAREEIPAYLTVSPLTGTLAPGEQTEITVDFDATALGYGTYRSELVVDVAGAQKLVVPTSLTMTGASAIALNRTVLKNTVEYRKAVKSNFEISNTGGSSLTYQLDVLGGTVNVDTTTTAGMKAISASEQRRMVAKQTLDNRLSRPLTLSGETSVQILTGKSLLKENFEGTFPPAGWQGEGWQSTQALGAQNYSGGGLAAMLRPEKAGEAGQQLLSPVIQLRNNRRITLQYQANYQNYANQDFLDLDIRVNGEEKWTNLLHWNEDHGQLYGKGELVKVELEKHLQNASSFQLRWHHTTTGTEGWYTQLDNVELLEEAHPWLTVSPAAGTLPARGSADITATFDAAYVDKAGDYLAGIIVKTDAANVSQIGVVASMHVLTAPRVSFTPDSVYVEAMTGYLAADTITLTNEGESSWKYQFSNSNGWTGGFTLPYNSGDVVDGKSSREIRVEMNTFKAPGIYHDTLYITGVDPYYPSLKVPITLKVLPAPPQLSVVQDTIRAEVKVGQLVTVPYQISNVGGQPLEVTMYKRSKTPWMTPSPLETQSILPDSSLSFLLEFDARQLSAGVYRDTLFYKTNDPRWSADQYVIHPFVLTVLPNPAVIHVDPQHITQTVQAGAQATASFAIHNAGGTPLGFNILNLKAIPWLRFEPGNGLVFPDSSLSVQLHLDATSLETGVYTDTLFIANSDPQNGFVPLPITLTVLPKEEVDGVTELVLINIRTGEELYSLTDSLVLDVAHPGFYDYGIVAKTAGAVQKVSFSLDGEMVNTDQSAPYALATLTLAQLSKGTYWVSAQASDSAGLLGEEKKVWLTVFNSALVSGVDVVNPLGEVLTTLHSGDTINIGDAAYSAINLKALMSERGVGSVKFYLNGEHVETDNVAPYSLAGDLLGYFYQSWKAKPGHYQLRVVPYSLPYGVGVMGQAYTVEFEVVNGMPQSGSQAGGSQTPPAQVELSLYPNPTERELTVSLEGVESAEVVLQIRNGQGQLLYSESLKAKQLKGHRLSLEGLHLLPGLYYLQVVDQTGTIQAKKFIKR